MCLICIHHYFCCSAKRSRHVADTHRTTGGTEVEHTLFNTMAQQAGLHVNSGQIQDELGEVCVSPSLGNKVPDISPGQSVHPVKNMQILLYYWPKV